MVGKQKILAPAELATFNMGYKAAMGILKDLLTQWIQAEQTHSACQCSQCNALREIATMKYIGPEAISSSESK